MSKREQIPPPEPIEFEQKQELEILGPECDEIARDIFDIVSILHSWGASYFRMLPGAMVPVVLDAIDRAFLRELERLCEFSRDHSNLEILEEMNGMIVKARARIAERKRMKYVEEAA